MARTGQARRGGAGLAVAHSRGEGGYRSEAGDGTVESTLTGVYPYGHYDVSERLTVWGVAGYGTGTLTLTPAGMSAIETDMALSLAAAGLRNELSAAPAEGGLALTATSDAMVVRTTSDEVRGSAGSLSASEAEVTRLRLGLEGSWQGLGTEGGGSFVPRFEIGVRHDGGDAETGLGVDIGAGLSWTDPSQGIRADLSARGLLTHAEDGFRERGFAGSFAWDPDPASELGPSLSLSQTVGAQATGGMEALLRPGTVDVLGEAGEDDDDDLSRRRLEAKLGYGFAVFGGGWTGVPEVGLGLTDTSRETTLGWRLAETRSAGLGFGLEVEGVRSEALDGEGAPEHRIGLGLGWRLEGAGAGSFEVRFEGTRQIAANDDAAPDDRLGVKLTARW